MAYPIILLDSAAGSDTAASGAGPSSALTGNAATTADGVTFILNAGTNLTGVATDGSHALWVNDTTAGNRNFGKITSTSGSGGATPTVVVAETFATIAVGKTWAIGGTRQFLSHASTIRLLNNNAASGDAMPGWTMRMNNSGYTDTFTSYTRFFRPGDTTDGPIILEGAAGLGTPPLLTANYDQSLFFPEDYWWLRDFDIENTSVSKASSNGGISTFFSASGKIYLGNIRIGRTGNGFLWGIYCANGNTRLVNVEVAFSTNYGVLSVNAPIECTGLYTHDNGGPGFRSEVAGQTVYACVFSNNGDDGFEDASGDARQTLRCCVFDGNTNDGYHRDSVATMTLFTLQDCQFTNNGGYGAFFGANVPFATTRLGNLSGNNFYNNSSGITDASPNPFYAYLTEDPQYVNAGAGDFTPQNTLLKGAAQPTEVANATNYQWIGPIQPNATGGSTIVLPGIFGG